MRLVTAITKAKHYKEIAKKFQLHRYQRKQRGVTKGKNMKKNVQQWNELNQKS